MFSALVISIILALIFSAILLYGFRRRSPGPAGGLLFLFLIIFMFSWAGGGWLNPMGPEYWGISWANYLLVALFIMLLLGAILPPHTPKRPPVTTEEEVAEQREADAAIGITFGAFFWILIVMLLILAIANLTEPPPAAEPYPVA